MPWINSSPWMKFTSSHGIRNFNIHSLRPTANAPENGWLEDGNFQPWDGLQG